MKKIKVSSCLLLLSCALLIGCGNKASTDIQERTDNTKISGEKKSEENNSGAVTGKIESMDGTALTISVVNMGGNNRGGEKGQRDGQEPSGDMPSGEQMQKPDGDMPSGEAPRGDMPNREAPDGEQMQKPDGEMPRGNMPGGETTTVTLTADTKLLDAERNTITTEDLKQGDMISVELDSDGNAASVTILNMSPSMGGMEGNSQGAPSSLDALLCYTEDISICDETINSTGKDENAIHISEGASVVLERIVLNRTSDDSAGGDASSFYGVGAAILTTDGHTEITDSTIETDAAGAAGVFAYGNGVVNVKDTVITTKQDTSGGIHVAGGGTLQASNLTVETSGESSAAIRSDRGGGTMAVDGGSYTTNGPGSPAVYSTADISVKNATLTANGSEAVCIEGLNTLELTDCTLSGNMSDLSQNDCTWTVILYQSMSGDSEIGNSTFTMNGGTLISENGGIFYTTNTESTFYLSGVNIIASEEQEFFLKCTGNQNERGWGQNGANGANCTFYAEAQSMEGDILWDSISTLDFYMNDGSVFTGAMLKDENAAGNGGEGYANVTISENSTWIVTSDSRLSKLSCEGTIMDKDQNSVTILGTDGTTYVTGNSSYIITVDAYN